MKIERTLLWLIGLLLTASVVSAGVTWTKNDGWKAGDRTIWVYTAAVQTAENVANVGTTTMHGEIIRAVSLPGITTNRPLAAYDCTVGDSEGADLSGLSLLNLINTTNLTTRMAMTMGTYNFWEPRVDGVVSLTCSNMGTATQASVKLFVRE